MVVPLYVKHLGVEAYGLIGFMASLQVVFGFLDMGLAPALNREIARCKILGNLNEARVLLHSLTFFYFLIAVLIIAATIAFAPFIAGGWLRSSTLSPDSLSHAIMLMGLVIACRWPLALYQSVLVGMQRIDITSALSILMTTLGGVGGVVVVSYVSPTIEALFVWQASTAILFTVIIRLIAWDKLGHYSANFKISSLKRIWHFSVGMSGVAITGLILLQLDKLLVSKIVDLNDFGKYALAGTLASGLYVLMTPLFNVIYPKLSGLVASEKINELITFYKTSSYLFMAIFAPSVVTAILYSGDFLVLWVQDKSLAESITPIVQFILIGTALNGIMHFPYALQLAFGATYIPITINVILIIIMIPLTIVLTKNYGVSGGAGAWAILNGLYVVIGTTITHRFLLVGHGLSWISKDVLLPITTSMSIIFLGRYFIQGYSDNSIFRLILSIGFMAISFLCVAVMSSAVRSIFIKKLKPLFGAL
jgi:O-antigen/teichoic acid export membrane protein